MGNGKVTKLRIQIPKGMTVEDVVQRLEISFEPTEGSISPHFNTGECCVDVAVGPTVFPVSQNGGAGDGGA